MPTNCSAAKQLPQFYKHSKSADLLRKSLLFHVWRVPSSKALSCKHERLFDLLTLASYNKDKLIAASFAFEGGLFFSKPITDWMEIPGNKIMCHEFVVVDMEYRGNGIQKRFMDATIREARQMGYDTIWCCAHPNNTPSVCSIESTGYKFADQFVVDGWPRNVYYRSTSIQR